MAVQDNFLRTLADIQRRLQTLEKIYQLIGSDGILSVEWAKIANVIIDSAQIDSLSASKITSGTFSVSTLIDIGTGAGGSYVRLDGTNNRIIVHDGTNPRIVIGNV